MAKAPPVQHSLDLSAHAGDPCDLLTEQDYAFVGPDVSVTKFGDPKIEPLCLAQNPSETRSLDVELYFQVNLLDSVYLHLRDDDGQPVNASFVNGYPAIFDDESFPGCAVIIATAVEQSIQLRYKNAEAGDQACKLVTEVADRVLRRLGA